MAEWGRKEYQSWPSRKPLASYGAFFFALVFFACGMWWQYAKDWSFLERYYLPMYAKTWMRGSLLASNQARYQLLDVVDAKGKERMAVGGEVAPVKRDDGAIGYAPTDEARQQGAVRLKWNDGVFNDQALHRYLGHWIYQDQTVWEYVERPVYGSLAVFVLGLFVAVPKDRKRALVYKHGRRLRGPELVTTAEFNERLGQKKGLTTYLPDGLAFINENQSWAERTFSKNETRWVRLPREREAMHLLVVGDSGHGKSAIVRQALTQIWERGETAVVYDPAMEYLPQFYDPRRGDVILNPVPRQNTIRARMRRIVTVTSDRQTNRQCDSPQQSMVDNRCLRLRTAAPPCHTRAGWWADAGLSGDAPARPAAYRSTTGDSESFPSRSCLHLHQQRHIIAGQCHVYGGYRQMWVVLHVQSRRSSLNAAEQKMLHCVEADRAQKQCVFDGAGYFLDREGLQQAKHLNILAASMLVEPGFEQAAQCREALRQLPTNQRRGLIESACLLFK